MPRCIICDGSSDIDPEFANVSFYWDTDELGWLCDNCLTSISYGDEPPLDTEELPVKPKLEEGTD